jgi:signal transduction histidine kinase
MNFINYKAFKKTLLLKFFLFACFSAGAQKIVVSSDITFRFSSNSWDYIKTKDKNLQVKEILTLFENKKFKPIKTNVLNGGIPGDYYWIHFSLSNIQYSNSSLFIDIESPRLNELELFELSNNEVRSLGKLGDFFPFRERTILNKNYIYNIKLGPNQSKDYFLFINQVGHEFILPIEIFTQTQFIKAVYNDYLVDGLTYGVLLFVSTFSLLFFISTRHFLYLYYALYIITAIIWLLSYFGLGYQYFWGNYPSLSTISAPLMASLNILLNIQICKIILRLQWIDKILNRACSICQVLLFLVGIFPVFLNLNNYAYFVNHTYLIIFLSIILISTVLIFYSVVTNLFKGSLIAKVYFAASLLKALSILNLALLELGITPAFYNMETQLQIGILIEITLLTYAIAKRYTTYRFKTYKQVIQAHEEERSNISKEIHDCISSSLTGLNFAFVNLINKNSFEKINGFELSRIAKELNDVQLESRYISHDLLPGYIKQYSLREIVERYISETKLRYNSNASENNLKLSFSSNLPNHELNEEVKLNIFRIIQELITNLIKHSKATSAEIIFSFNKKLLEIILEDNGVGFKHYNSNNGIGLKNIQSRIRLLDGHIQIHSCLPDLALQEFGKNFISNRVNGTLIIIKIPLNNKVLLPRSSDF